MSEFTIARQAVAERGKRLDPTGGFQAIKNMP